MCTTYTEKVNVATQYGRLGSDGERVRNTAGKLVPEFTRRGNTAAGWFQMMCDMVTLCLM